MNMERDSFRSRYFSGATFSLKLLESDLESWHNDGLVDNIQRVPFDITSLVTLGDINMKDVREALSLCAAWYKQKDLEVEYASARCEVYRGLWECSLREPDAKHASYYRFEWLKICYATGNEGYNFYFQTHPIATIDREQEIRRMLFPPDGTGPLDTFFAGTPEGRAYFPALVQWFLRRYDLSTAFRLIRFSTSSLPALVVGKGLPRRIGMIAFAIVVLMVFAFTNLYNDHSYLLPHHWVRCNFSCEKPARVFELVLYLFATAAVAYRPSCGILLPRLIGGILVGYLFLISSDSIVTFAVNANPFTVYLVGAFSLGLSYLLLSFEVRRSLGTTRSKIVERTTTLLCLGFIESTVIGFLVADLFSDIFFQHIGNEILRPANFPGLFAGSMYPKVIILFIPLALLVGIVLQLFWEEKPISQL